MSQTHSLILLFLASIQAIYVQGYYSCNYDIDCPYGYYCDNLVCYEDYDDDYYYDDSEWWVWFLCSFIATLLCCVMIIIMIRRRRQRQMEYEAMMMHQEP